MERFKAGEIVVVDRKCLNVKEHIGKGIYQTNEVVSGKLIFFDARNARRVSLRYLKMKVSNGI